MQNVLIEFKNIASKFILLDAEMGVLQLMGLAGELTTGRDFDYVYYIGLIYACVRLGWYIYSRIHEKAKNQIDRENAELEKQIKEEKLKSWKILNSPDFKSSLGKEKLEEIKGMYSEEDKQDNNSLR